MLPISYDIITTVKSSRWQDMYLELLLDTTGGVEIRVDIGGELYGPK